MPPLSTRSDIVSLKVAKPKRKGDLMKVSTYDYSGKKVFVGMDVHKKSYVIAAHCDGVIVKRWTTSPSRSKTAAQLKKYFVGAEIHSAYEAGFSGFSLHRVFVSAGIHNRVVNAASIEVESNNRVKTDKRDAQKIAVGMCCRMEIHCYFLLN